MVIGSASRWVPPHVFERGRWHAWLPADSAPPASIHWWQSPSDCTCRSFGLGTSPSANHELSALQAMSWQRPLTAFTRCQDTRVFLEAVPNFGGFTVGTQDLRNISKPLAHSPPATHLGSCSDHPHRFGGGKPSCPMAYELPATHPPPKSSSRKRP